MPLVRLVFLFPISAELLADKREVFDEYARCSDMANATPDAVDTASETELRRRIVAAEQKRLKAA